ncbi:MAG: GTP cyclohydrolase I [Nitrososphaeraceae archaeon]|nr:GTP cyclohydrolase I [Nitrososphaeraceae archaeon]
MLVIAEGEHLCMKMRGVKNNSSIMTVAYRGIFEERDVRENVLALIYTRQNNIINI